MGYAAALACCATASGAGPSALVTFDFDGHGVICVDAPGAAKPASTCRKRYAPAQQDIRFKRAMRGAEETAGVLHYDDSGKSYLVFLVSAPSNPAHRTGYCGAGYEDSLVSARIDGDTLRLTHRLLIQSCRASLALEGGRPDSVVTALTVSSAPRQISFRRESQARDTVILLRSGAFHETPMP